MDSPTSNARKTYTLEFQKFKDAYQEGYAKIDKAIQQVSKAYQKNPNPETAQYLQNKKSEKSAFIKGFINDLQKELGNGAKVKFEDNSPISFIHTLLHLAEISTLKKMVQNQSNIHTIVFRSTQPSPMSPAMAHQGKETWLQQDESLLSKILNLPPEKKSQATYDFLGYALRRGAEPDFSVQSLEITKQSDIHESPSRTHYEKNGSIESLLHIAAKNLDLKAMKILLDHDANPNIGKYHFSSTTRTIKDYTEKKTIDTGIMKTLMQQLRKRSSYSNEFYTDFVDVVNELCERGIKLDAKRGNLNLDIHAIPDPKVRNQVKEILTINKEKPYQEVLGRTIPQKDSSSMMLHKM